MGYPARASMPGARDGQEPGVIMMKNGSSAPIIGAPGALKSLRKVRTPKPPGGHMSLSKPTSTNACTFGEDELVPQSIVATAVELDALRPGTTTQRRPGPIRCTQMPPDWSDTVIEPVM